MTGYKMLPIPGHGEYTENPLHDIGQRFITVRVDYEMNMITHNTKIINLKAVLLFCPFYGIEKEGPHSITVHNHLPSIGPGGDMISRPSLKNSVVSHTLYYGSTVGIALIYRYFLALSPNILWSIKPDFRMKSWGQSSFQMMPLRHYSCHASPLRL
jgi:hypothetical protein